MGPHPIAVHAVQETERRLLLAEVARHRPVGPERSVFPVVPEVAAVVVGLASRLGGALASRFASTGGGPASGRGGAGAALDPAPGTPVGASVGR